MLITSCLTDRDDAVVYELTLFSHIICLFVGAVINNVSLNT